MQMEKKIKKGEKALDSKRPDLVAVEAQITHSTRKMNNAQKTKQDVAKTQSDLEGRVHNLETELAKVKRDADKAQEAQRRMSQNNLALNDERLEEYRSLKTSANLLAVEERQKLEKIIREEKAAVRALNALNEKQQGFKDKRDSRNEEVTSQTKKKTELEERIAGLQNELNTKKQELENQQSERNWRHKQMKSSKVYISNYYRREWIEMSRSENESSRRP
ncbi:hypothetical protein F5890DRAFT_406855 [Lentinula detonsa]|uniref:Uncharacterized protein n=1 Tax=Lentinula detonsa TaxID=2804962 RepID=A0AA38PV78_9AGAR|nr:hypothetical protein F5890DRAFT_406855 [Lentinula detonsa]